MTNPVKNMQRSVAEYKQMSSKDKKRYVSDLVLNNALYKYAGKGQVIITGFCIF